MAEFFSTGTACGACDKYEVWFHALSFSIQLCLTLTHVSYEASLLKHQVCFSLRPLRPPLRAEAVEDEQPQLLR